MRQVQPTRDVAVRTEGANEAKRLVDAPHAEVDRHHICVVRSRPKNSWILSSMRVSACAMRAFRASSSRPSSSGRELDVALGERAGDLRGDLGTLMQDPFEAGLVEAVALDVGQGHDVGAPRLAGEHPHLAEEARRLDGRHGLGHVALGEVPPDLDLPRAQDVEPVRHGALPGHGLARRVRHLLQVLGERRALVGGERMKELDAVERGEPALAVPAARARSPAPRAKERATGRAARGGCPRAAAP